MSQTPTPENLPRLYRLADLIGEVQADADAAHEARLTGKPRGPITGLAKLDKELAGALPPGLNMLLGNTGTGKTAFALQTAAQCQFPALFVSCEMAPRELLRRHTARVTSTYLGRLKSGEMTGASVAGLARQSLEAAPLLAIMDATAAPATPVHIREIALTLRGDHKQILIVLDSLHSWAPGVISGAGEYDILGEALAELRTLAHATQSPLLIVSEQSRGNMKTGGANSGAGHRSIEYGAETVIELRREEDAQEDGSGEVPVTLKLHKNRHGAPGKSFALKFCGALQSYREA
jgi:replicative DNA helicase